MPGPRSEALVDFRRRCREHGLAVTFQRQVIYEAVIGSRRHPTPEWIFEEVKKRIPCISLGTVYKNVKTFVDSGVLREVTLHHGTVRLESNPAPHHHLVCTTCKTIIDIEESALAPLRFPPDRLPPGFSINQYRVEFTGECQACQKARQKPPQPKKGIRSPSCQPKPNAP